MPRSTWMKKALSTQVDEDSKEADAETVETFVQLLYGKRSAISYFLNDLIIYKLVTCTSTWLITENVFPSRYHVVKYLGLKK